MLYEIYKSKKENLGFFDCKCLQWVTLYVGKHAITEKTYLKLRLWAEKNWPL